MAPALMTLSFIEHLEKQLRESPPKQKGLRTRQRLKIATAKVLEKKGYHAMRVTDITARAKLAEGSFYVYFTDKSDAALTVLSELLTDFLALESQAAPHNSPFDAIRATNRRWLAVCRANAGLMRCILQLGDEDPSLALLAQQSNGDWYDRVALSIGKRRRTTPERRGSALFAAYMMGGMMDDLVRKLIIYPDPGFHKLLAELKVDDDGVADAASIIWLRVFHPESLPPDDLPAAAAALAEWMMPNRR